MLAKTASSCRITRLALSAFVNQLPVHVQKAGPAALALDSFAHLVGPGAMAFEMPMFKFDQGGAVVAGRERNMHLAAFCWVGLVGPIRTHMPSHDEVVGRVPLKHRAPFAVLPVFLDRIDVSAHAVRERLSPLVKTRCDESVATSRPYRR